jgi:predicted dehydrogenase
MSAGKMKFGIVGIGGIGRQHAANISGSDEVDLAAICDMNLEAAEELAAQYEVPAFATVGEMLGTASVDGVVVAVPHPAHRPVVEEVFAAGKHVIVEKPLAAHIEDARAMIRAHEEAQKQFGPLIFSAMFQQRTHGNWRRMRDLITGGTLGRLMRTTWIITNWFRTQAYYNAGGWRATWSGEGGGVLMNQAPHNLDLYQWLTGRPSRITAVAGFGKYHDIEVEDEVSMVLEHPNGMVGQIITSTAESPGTNRLEIVGEYGSLVYENDRLIHTVTDGSVLSFIHESQKRFTQIDHQRTEIDFAADEPTTPPHQRIVENVAAAWRGEAELVAPAAEGLYSLEIANGAVLSAYRRSPVDVPVDPAAYDEAFQELQRGGAAHGYG